MNKEDFLNDLQKIYGSLDKQRAKTNKLLEYLENKKFDKL